MFRFSKNASVDLQTKKSLLNCELLEPRMMLSTVQLFASGSEGGEQMELRIDDATVQAWTVNSGASQGTFDTYTYETANTVNADQVRVAFTNDQYDPANGIDANLRLDAIEIDGVRYETEDPSVFSTGTWLPADGIVEGFRESEFMHTNGYFQFAGSGPEPGDGTVLINEILYNPGPDGVVDGDAEFLELYNPSDSAIDLSGMSFVGFDLTFVAGTSLGAGEYAIVAPSNALAQSTWGVTPLAEFTSGGLSGGGELIQLLAADGVTVVDEVSYLDESPWPATPDGNGPSLELRDAATDNSLAENWGASIGGPTPGAINSIVGVAEPEDITNITVDPSEVLPNQAFSISATIEGATTANLVYKVMFGADQTVAMTNIGGDVWQGTLPGQDAGTLVRYRIESDVASAPSADESINYLGLVVSPTDIVGNELPIFQFFVDQDQFEELTTTELALTNTKIPAVVVYNGLVIDNATVRVRGGDHSREFFPKKSLKFELPSGFAIDVGDEGSYPIDEFGINADFGDWSVVTPDISWDVFNNETESFTTSFFTRVEMNGDFHGVFRFQELYDGAWRDANGLGDEDEFHKADAGGFGSSPKFDKKRPDDGDFSAITVLNDVLIADASPAKTAYLYENVDIANVVNHMALSTLMRHDDQRVQNFYMVLDADTQLWSIVEWDLDRTWVVASDDVDGGAFTTPLPIDHELLNSVFEVPEFQEMYWRRMQTIVDKYLTNDDLIDRRDELVNQIGATNSTLEFEKWNRNDIFANSYWADEWQTAIDGRREAFAAETRMPGTASGSYNIVINELHYNPLDGDAEFIELYNDSVVSVDLSGWTIDGIGLTIGFGTVILPGEHVVFTDNFAQFKAQYPGNIFVGSQYSGGLKGSGELVTLSDATGNVIDQVDYLDTDPWPTTPDGDGYTLSLINPSLDNSLASSWVASSQINGTPGNSNDSIIESYAVKVFAAGSTGAEIISLEIAGQQVGVYDLSTFGGQPGDLTARNFIQLTYLSDSPVSASDVRINFLNDSYDPVTGVDSNVAIDRIEIDGVAFETEAANVFSTGTYANGGIVPGFPQSETLHVNGYFQYNEAGVGNPNPIADGNTIQLLNADYDAWLSVSGLNAVTSTTNDTRTQWELIGVGNDQYKVLNVNSGRYLDGDVANIDTTSNSDANGTVWQFEEYADGQYYIFNVRYSERIDALGPNRSVIWDPAPLELDDVWIASIV